ncbi:hypothetical protein D3C79_530310 [compost metagenome]
MEAKKQKMNGEITRYNDQLTGVTPSQAGDGKGPRSAAEMKAATRQYQSDVEALNKQISTLQQKK